jgi:ribosomal-protein-alanine N-acetyltransferase
MRSREPLPAAWVDPLVESDLDAVVEIAREAFSNPWTREAFRRELEHGRLSRNYVVRTRQERVAGFCSCWLVFDELHINTIAVRARLRGQGLASLLLRHVLADAAQAGARRATLEVRQSNEPALRLYRRFGFVVSGVRRQYYTDPVEDALMLGLDPIPPP